MRVTGGGAHQRGLAPGLNSSEETSPPWRAVGDTVCDLTGSGIAHKISRTLTGRLILCFSSKNTHTSNFDKIRKNTKSRDINNA